MITYLDFHCPTEMAVGTMIFPVRVEEQLFSNIVLNSLKAFKYKTLLIRVLLSSTKMEVLKDERLPRSGREPTIFWSVVGRSTNHRMIWYDLAVFTIIAHPQELSESKGSNCKGLTNWSSSCRLLGGLLTSVEQLTAFYAALKMLVILIL